MKIVAIAHIVYKLGVDDMTSSDQIVVNAKSCASKRTFIPRLAENGHHKWKYLVIHYY